MKVKKGKRSRGDEAAEDEVEVPSVLLKKGKNARRNKLKKMNKKQKLKVRSEEDDIGIETIDIDVEPEGDFVIQGGEEELPEEVRVEGKSGKKKKKNKKQKKKEVSSDDDDDVMIDTIEVDPEPAAPIEEDVEEEQVIQEQEEELLPSDWMIEEERVEGNSAKKKKKNKKQLTLKENIKKQLKEKKKGVPSDDDVVFGNDPEPAVPFEEDVEEEQVIQEQEEELLPSDLAIDEERVEGKSAKKKKKKKKQLMLKEKIKKKKGVPSDDDVVFGNYPEPAVPFEEDVEEEQVIQEQEEELLPSDLMIEEERVEVETPPTKIRKTVGSNSVEDNFIIVPWASREEWDTACQHFHAGSYNEVITRIGVWQRRVPALPVGVEASLFLLEALIFDEKFSNPIISAKGFYTEDQARSLYSLAIVRYMNHVSQLATQTLGETSSRPARELAAIVNAPEWLVSVRNEVSHGASAPSIETLRMSGNFILHWLKERYWKLSSTSNSTDDLTLSNNQDEEKDIPNEITQLLTAYIAARIYKMRGLAVIRDFEIINRIPNCPSPVKTKAAVMSLRNELKSYLLSHSSALCHVVSQELIPNSEFYEDFVSILDIDEDTDKDEFAFEKLFEIWLPLIKLLESKGKLIAILGNLCDIFVNPDFEKMWGVTARWIDKLLEVIEFSGKQYSKHLVKLLEIVVKHPNNSMNIFMERLFRLTEIRLGSESITKLTFLVSIWLEDKSETKKRKKPSLNTFFSVNDIQEIRENDLSMETETADDLLQSSKWMMDSRGEDYWRAIPIGAVV